MLAFVSLWVSMNVYGGVCLSMGVLCTLVHAYERLCQPLGFLGDTFLLALGDTVGLGGGVCNLFLSRAGSFWYQSNTLALIQGGKDEYSGFLLVDIEHKGYKSEHKNKVQGQRTLHTERLVHLFISLSCQSARSPSPGTTLPWSSK